jgi:hypothetical protein
MAFAGLPPSPFNRQERRYRQHMTCQIAISTTFFKI